MARHAEIAGAGITGLTTAILLARRGWTVRVHERGSSIREIGAGIFIKNNGIRVFEDMGVADTVFRRAVRFTRAEIRDERGTLIQRRPLIDKARVYNPPRQDVVNGLSSVACKLGVEVICSSEAISADPEGFIELSGGRRHRADLVVAADGFRSQLRESLGLTSAAFDLSNGATRVLVPRTAFESENITREFWSGKRRIGIAPCTNDLVYSYMSCPQTDIRGRSLPVDVESWNKSFPTIKPSGFFERANEDAGATRFAYPYAKANSWTKGRVVLLGDAAHAMPPTLGQGAGLAVTNARALARMLDTIKDVREALLEWERKFRWITDDTQKWARRYDALTSNWPHPLGLVRWAIIWSFGKVTFLNDRMRVADHIVIE